MKPDRTCAACGAPFTPLAQIPNQRYCSSKSCQLAGRRAWQHERMRTTPDYRANQTRAQTSWCARLPNYWRRYSEAHPPCRDHIHV